MIPHKAAQGTREWHDARARILTASKFTDVLTPARLEASKGEGAIKLAYRIAAARLWGVYEEEKVTWEMQRGTELEPEAVLEYEERTGRECIRVGLCLTDDGLFGASPDSLVGDDGGLEIKCPNLDTHLENLRNRKVPTKYRLQIQGGLWVTGRAWWDFFSYYPGLPPLIIRVEPDPAVFAAFDEALPNFEHEVRLAVAELETTE